MARRWGKPPTWDSRNRSYKEGLDWTVSKYPKTGKGHKFAPGDIVKDNNDNYYVVVDYRLTPNWAGYRFVPINTTGKPLTAHPRWDKSTGYEKAELPPHKKKGMALLRRYRRWRRMDPEEVGCACLCCTHTSMAPSQVRYDGEWKEDSDD